MGYGLGASLGAKVGRPEKTVVNIAGDGCFRMNMNEIATATRHNIPVIQVVINNHVLGMVRQWQNLFYEQRYSATVLNDAVDFVKLAEAMGAEGVRASTREEFKEAFAKALKSGHPVVIDCQIDSDDKVWPMVAPGAPISEAFDEKDLKKDLDKSGKTAKDILIEGMKELGLGDDPSKLDVTYSLAGTSDWFHTFGEYLQQGFEGLGRKQTEWKAWMEREKEALTEIAQAHEFVYRRDRKSTRLNSSHVF